MFIVGTLRGKLYFFAIEYLAGNLFLEQLLHMAFKKNQVFYYNFIGDEQIDPHRISILESTHGSKMLRKGLTANRLPLVPSFYSFL